MIKNTKPKVLTEMHGIQTLPAHTLNKYLKGNITLKPTMDLLISNLTKAINNSALWELLKIVILRSHGGTIN